MEGRIEPLKGWAVSKREFFWMGSRFDLLLQKGKSRCIVEVKASTLLKGTLALFPDAPTLRGRRHLDTLAIARGRGYRACAVFLVHRSRAASFSTNYETDPGFASSFGEARRRGVETYAYQCRWKGRDVRIVSKLPIMVNV